MKVFISAAYADKDLAQRIAAGLAEAGFEIFHDEQLLPGEDWAGKIAQALRDCEAMVVVLTEEALRSTNVRREIEYALSDKTYKNRLIPVVIGSLDNLPEENLPWILHHLRMIKLPKHGKQAKGIQQIAQALRTAA